MTISYQIRSIVVLVLIYITEVYHDVTTIVSTTTPGTARTGIPPGIGFPLIIIGGDISSISTVSIIIATNNIIADTACSLTLQWPTYDHTSVDGGTPWQEMLPGNDTFWWEKKSYWEAVLPNKLALPLVWSLQGMQMFSKGQWGSRTLSFVPLTLHQTQKYTITS